jgi:cytidylate kinase
MDKKHIITIAGRPGSGKSTTSKAVAGQLGYGRFSSGDLFRTIGREHGLELLDANKAAQQSDDIDGLVDRRLIEIGKSQDQLAIDSRLAWHWIPGSFKVYLDLDLEVAARRILANMDPIRKAHEHVPDDPKQYAKVLQHRLDLEAVRYKAKYDANPYDKSNYDLVIDTAIYAPDQVVAQILDAYHKWLGGDR